MTVLKFTIVGTYEVDPKGYDTKDPRRMAEIDQDEVDSGGVSIGDVIAWADDRDISLRIEPT